MMKLDQIKPIPGFDSLKWKAERQAEILRETEGMTNEEILAYYRKGSEAFQAEMKRLRAERAAEAQT
jgi:hypothetical protein